MDSDELDDARERLKRQHPGADELLTPDEAAHRLKVTRRYVLRLGREGKLAPVRFSRKVVRFRPEDVDAFAAQHRQAGGPASRARVFDEVEPLPARF